MKTLKTGVTLDVDLLEKLNRFMEIMGYKNRSRIINKALELYITEKMSLMGEGLGVGVLTLIYDHHIGNIEHEMTHIQHDHLDIIISNLHIHLDKDNCLEVIVVKGDINKIRGLVNQLEKLRGIKIIRHILSGIE
jgi:CopG family nickel-responsive transcriptional regulator